MTNDEIVLHDATGRLRRPRSRVVSLVLLLSLTVSAGCLDNIPAPADILVLEYTLTSVGREETREVAGGAHCATVWFGGSVATLTRWQYDALDGTDRFLIVDPSFAGRWSMIGNEPYAAPFPAEIAAVKGGPNWTTIDLSSQGPRVADEVVSLPHEWQVVADDGSWRVDARLYDGPAHRRVVADRPCM